MRLSLWPFDFFKLLIIVWDEHNHRVWNIYGCSLKIMPKTQFCSLRTQSVGLQHCRPAVDVTLEQAINQQLLILWIIQCLIILPFHQSSQRSGLQSIMHTRHTLLRWHCILNLPHGKTSLQKYLLCVEWDTYSSSLYNTTKRQNNTWKQQNFQSA